LSSGAPPRLVRLAAIRQLAGPHASCRCDGGRSGAGWSAADAGHQELRFASEHERLQAAQGKFKAVADQYPSSDAGIFARYREASIWLALGNTEASTRAYADVVARSGNNVLGQMARLGPGRDAGARRTVRPGHHDVQDLSQNKDGPLPVDGILMQMGRAYRDAGKRTEAQQTFNRIVEEFPDSPFGADAKKELDNLKKT